MQRSVRAGDYKEATMGQGLSDLIKRIASDPAFRDAVADSIVRTATQHGIQIGDDERATIANALGQLATSPDIAGDDAAPWPAGPSFTSSALDETK
jgi:hypothetical protein